MAGLKAESRNRTRIVGPFHSRLRSEGGDQPLSAPASKVDIFDLSRTSLARVYMAPDDLASRCGYPLDRVAAEWRLPSPPLGLPPEEVPRQPFRTLSQQWTID